MLSSLPKLADRNFVLGFLLPVLIFAVAGLVLYRDVDPITAVWCAILHEKSLTELTLLAIAIWSGAVLLFVFNHSLYQLLEGYRGPFNRSKWRAAMMGQFGEEKAKLKAMHTKMTELGSAEKADITREYYKGLQQFYQRFPFRKHLVLPTRFGNVVRAFETYSLKVYGVDSIPGWLRLAGVVPKQFQTLIDNARAEVDFFINFWALSILFAFMAGVRFAIWVVASWPISAVGNGWMYPAAAAAGIGIAALSYERAIRGASAWGNLVKSAFDLYLPALAKQLGYRLPDTKTDRDRFWDDVNSMFLYQVPLVPENWPAADPPAQPGQQGDSAPGANAPGKEEETEDADDDAKDGDDELKGPGTQ